MKRGMKGLRDDFVAAMARKTNRQARNGWSGWDDGYYYNSMRERVFSNARKGDWVDVANLAMFLWGLDGKAMRMKSKDGAGEGDQNGRKQK